MAFRTTQLSALSVGIDPARTVGPLGRATAGQFSVGTVNFAGIKRISTSVVSVNPANLTANNVSGLTVSVPGAELDDFVVANPSSTWSGNYRWIVWNAQATADDVVTINFSNTSGTAINADGLNWRVTAIAF